MPAHKKGGRTPKGSITFRGSLQWQARLQLDGVAHVQTFETKNKAQAWIDRLLQARKRPDRFERAVAANTMTLAEAMRKRLSEKKRLAETNSKEATGCKTLVRQGKMGERLIERYPALFGRRIYDIDEIDIRDFIDARLESNVSNATVNRELSLISHTFSIAKAHLNCVKLSNPIGHSTRLQEPKGRCRRLEADEDAALTRAAAIYETESDVPIGDAFQFAAETAMRLSEVTGMDWRDVDLAKGTVFVSDTKNSEARMDNPASHSRNRATGLTILRAPGGRLPVTSRKPVLARSSLIQSHDATSIILLLPTPARDAVRRARARSVRNRMLRSSAPSRSGLRWPIWKAPTRTRAWPRCARWTESSRRKSTTASPRW